MCTPSTVSAYLVTGISTTLSSAPGSSVQGRNGRPDELTAAVTRRGFGFERHASPYHFPPPPPSYPIRCRTGSSPSNNRSCTLSIRGQRTISVHPE
jgi:hypothetical protein